MNTHAHAHDHDHGRGSTRAYSVLDWPTPEQLAEANRLRSRMLRDMTVKLWRGLVARWPRPAAHAAGQAGRQAVRAMELRKA